MNPNRPSAVSFWLVALFTSIFLGSASAQHEQAFLFNGLNGSNPQGGLVADTAGNLYGTTYAGGLYGQGIVFEGSPPVPPSTHWTQTTLYSFSGSPDGANPIGDLVLDQAGNLYGVTFAGGLGAGTIFQLSPPSQPGGAWIETVLYIFGSVVPDAASPMAGLVFDAVGNLYGTTYSGGAAGGKNFQGGTVFELSPPRQASATWVESILYAFVPFSLSDGSFPEASVTFDSRGNLYGTTLAGGTASQGTVFQLTPPSKPGGSWTENVLHNFGIGEDGDQPVAGLALTKSGALLGTASAGGVFQSGVAFGLSAPNGRGARGYGILYSFDGGTPKSSLTLQNGRAVYGTTYGGGSFSQGTVFQLTPPSSPGGGWTETTLYSFTGGKDGSRPVAAVLLQSRALYGTTSQGGYKDNGTAFRLSH